MEISSEGAGGSNPSKLKTSVFVGFDGPKMTIEAKLLPTSSFIFFSSRPRYWGSKHVKIISKCPIKQYQHRREEPGHLCAAHSLYDALIHTTSQQYYIPSGIQYMPSALESLLVSKNY